MGWLRKKAKQIGKAIKKIGKGIKKVMGKIMKPFAKLGIVGQIAMGFIMPWAAGAVWQGLTGTAFSMGSFGTVASGLAKSSNLFAKAAGKLMQGVHWGATKIQGAYNTITGAIGDGFKTIKTKAQEMFGIQADPSDLIKNAPDMKEFDFTTNIAEKAAESVTNPLTMEQQIAQNVTPEAILGDKVVEEAAEKTFFEKTKEKVQDKVIGQVGTSLATKIDNTINPTIDYPQGSNEVLTDFLSLGPQQAYTKYNETDISQLANQNTMLSNSGGLYANMNHAIQTQTSFGDDVWLNYMQGAR
jgi:hypothetical protein